MSYIYERQTIDSVASTLKGYGFRVFIAERGTYGFYTDESGKRIVCFQCSLGTLSFSGNYHSTRSGQGWRIADSIVTPTKDDAQRWLEANPPQWAIGNDAVTMKTMDDHLKQYQQSSQYKEV